MSILSIVHQSD